MPETPVAVFAVDADLLGRLESRLGPPIDSYLRGWQVWLEPTAVDEQQEIELEYRLHPPGGFRQPEGLDHHDLWDEVVAQVADSGDQAIVLGREVRALDQVWSLLEVYPAFGDVVDPAVLRELAERTLGAKALAHGTVDHDRLGGTFTQRGPDFDLPAALRAALGA